VDCGVNERAGHSSHGSNVPPLATTPSRWLNPTIQQPSIGCGSNGCLQSYGSCESPWRRFNGIVPGALCAAAVLSPDPRWTGQRYSKTSPLTVL
jgi:hypothetical protein